MTIKEFKEVYSIIKDGNISDNIIDDKNIFLLSYFSDINPDIIENMNLKQFKKLFKKYKNKMHYRPRIKSNKWFIHNGQLYIRRSLESFNWGDFVDLNFFIKDSINNIDELVKKRYKVYPNIDKKIDNLPIDKIYGSVNEMVEWHNNIIKQYIGLFKQKEIIDEDRIDPKYKEEYERELKEGDRWGLLGTTYELCLNNITLINDIFNKSVFEVFNFLSYVKEQQDKEKSNHNNKKAHL